MEIPGINQKYTLSFETVVQETTEGTPRALSQDSRRVNEWTQLLEP